MNIAMSPLPSKWDTNVTGTGSVTKNSDGTVKITDNDTSSIAYIYKCIQVSPGDTVRVSSLVNVNSGSVSLITSEAFFGASIFNQQRSSKNGLHEISVTHTVNLDSNTGKYIFIKIGSTGADTADADVLWCKAEITNSSIGALRDIAFADITINSGTATLNNFTANSGIASMAVTANGIEVEFDNIILLPRTESAHVGILPIIAVDNVFTPTTNYLPRIVSYDNATRKVVIRFWDLVAHAFVTSAATISTRIMIRVSVP